MFLSLNWLKDFIDIPKKITPEELGLRLTMHTVEIDSVQKQADKYRKIVVGKILEIKKHPNADKLQLVKVKINKEDLEIVCGAGNIEVGQLVPVALVGAVLPAGFEIKEAEIRGVKSSGMLCAEDELGLGDNHDGIFILDANAKIGQPLSDYLKLVDVIFEVDNKSITNRPDLWSHYGLAREIAAFLNLKLKDFKINSLDLLTNETTAKPDIKVDDSKLCPRYMALSLDGIKIEPSPKWLADRLVAVGVRPVSNIVDITNYVMLELGQPLHAFDKSLVDKIIVRRARNGELIETLDNEKRELDENMLVIADSAKPIAVAGVMGGAGSEINNETVSIIFEAANFDFVSIRKTSQKLGLRTEASIRYEKSLDPNLCETALLRAVDLTKQICPGAKVISGLADVKNFELNLGPIELDMNWLALFTGEKFREKKVVEILERLGFKTEIDGKKLKITIPTWRATKDISIKEDLAEEITRIFGYDNLNRIMPKVEMQAPQINSERLIERRLKNIMTGGLAFTEVYNYSFVGEDQIKKLGLDLKSHIKLANPISALHTLLRQNLASNFINNIKTNQMRFDTIKIFEIGRVFLGDLLGEENKNGEPGEKLPYQEKKLGIAMAGSRGDIFMEIKAALSNIFANFDLAVSFNMIEAIPYWAELNESAKILVNKLMVGSVFKLNHKVGQSFGLKKAVVMAEVSLTELMKIINAQSAKQHKEFEKFPAVIRDLAFVVKEKVLYNDIKSEISNFHEFIKSVNLFDVYIGEKIGQNKKNLAFHIIYQADKTLKSEEVDEIEKKLIKLLEEKFAAKIRDF
jgi:phenylalanyl-tRNA synthetase beta chain